MTSRELAAELDRLLAARDRSTMGPTIAALRVIHRDHPTDPRVTYELAGAYDTDGQEARARELYELAMEQGLEGDALRRLWVQYGSTLRNLGETEASLATFARARAEFSGSPSLAAFEGLALHAAGRSDEAIALLLETVADLSSGTDAERYQAALRGNAAAIRDAQS